LLADLEGAHLAGQQLDQPLGLGETVDVEREDQAVPQAVGGAADHRGTCRGPTRGSTRAATSPTGTSTTSVPARAFNSTHPRASARGPTVIRTGRPIKSASLNFTPGRSSRSSRSVSTPADSRSPATRSAVSRIAASLWFTGTTWAA